MKRIEELLRQAIAQVCAVDVRGLTEASRLEDVGIDSLASAEILVELEVRLGRQLPAGTLRRLEHTRTLGELAALLESAFALPAAPESP